MIAVVVIGILAAVALPAYNDSVRRSRRSEGIAALMAVQQAQERARSNSASYVSSVTAAPTDDPPGLGMSSTLTPHGYYALSISGASPTGYTASAVAQSGTSQAADTACSTISVRLAGGNLTYAGGSGDLSYTSTHPCWAK